MLSATQTDDRLAKEIQKEQHEDALWAKFKEWDTRVSDSKEIPDHVRSVQSLSDDTTNSNMTDSSSDQPLSQLTQSAEAYASLGEGTHVPEHTRLRKECDQR